jgi:ribosomal protein L37E
MAACPNCGRQTLRTRDWVCQWCGYPLISRAFRTIDKTYHEIQEERKLAAQRAEAGPEPELEPEPESEPEIESGLETESQAEAEPEPGPQPRTRPIPFTPPISREVPVKEKTPEPLYTPPPKTETQPKSLPEPVETPQQKPMVPPPAPPIILPAAEVPESEAETPSQHEPEPEETQPEPTPEPELEAKAPPGPPPEQPVRVDAVTDGMEITADQIDALFRADKSGAHAKLSGKTLVVKGKVDKVFIREHLEIRYIVLTGSAGKTTWSLRCTFNKENASKASRLTEGESVALRGKYDGYSKNIMFKDCVLL